MESRKPVIDMTPPKPKCYCLAYPIGKTGARTKESVEKLLQEKEESLMSQFNVKLEQEVKLLKERFDFILENEQIRTSYMLSEAHRERKEKISALQTQLECKNLAGLMYVLCSEKRKSKLEKLHMAQEYTKYIEVLQETLADAQSLILRLVKGYKTSTNLDEIWQNKMRAVVKEFQTFVSNFVGETPETNQYFFNLFKLTESELPEVESSVESSHTLSTEEMSDDEDLEDIEAQAWWDRLEGDNVPFVVFGDMADFKPNVRRNVLKALKKPRSEDKENEYYAMNDKFIKSDCPNANIIKEDYLKLLPKPGKWECATIQTERENSSTHRLTQASVDIRGNMGSILKIIASCGYNQHPPKATILGARDSMEIASTTKMRERIRNSASNKVILNIGSKRGSKFDAYKDLQGNASEEVATVPRYCFDYRDWSQSLPLRHQGYKRSGYNDENDDIVDESFSALGSIHNDSLQVIPSHVPDRDAKINYEKVCPMDECQKMQVDSFIRSLPPYMQASPYMHFENTFEEYEPCTTEQLEILKERIDSRKRKSKFDLEKTEELLDEWDEESNTIAVQTSEQTLDIPPCTCPPKQTADDTLYNIEDLAPVKLAIDEINKKFFFDDRIQFNRFEVVGLTGDNCGSFVPPKRKDQRMNNLNEILRNRPSLCDLFQGNAR
ncbi:uncharacterized protein [Battus philenor]|uniref:uncharacterized protein n=1 Tax=Battus philenor TaxID=42288 RepID=UPI0035CF2CD9